MSRRFVSSDEVRLRCRECGYVGNRTFVVEDGGLRDLLGGDGLWSMDAFACSRCDAMDLETTTEDANDA